MIFLGQQQNKHWLRIPKASSRRVKLIDDVYIDNYVANMISW